MQAFNAYCDPDKNETVERYPFFSCNQIETEVSTRHCANSRMNYAPPRVIFPRMEQGTSTSIANNTDMEYAEKSYNAFHPQIRSRKRSVHVAENLKKRVGKHKMIIYMLSYLYFFKITVISANQKRLIISKRFLKLQEPLFFKQIVPIGLT